MLAVLLRRKAVSARNAFWAQTRWELGRNAAFLMVGLWMLAGLYIGFLRLLRHLETVQIIGPLLIWKLTAMALMTTFSMVVLSSLIISLTTLYYSYDLPFLMNSPAPHRTVFIDKSIDSAFYSSWMIGLVLLPFMLALGQVKGVGLGFYAAYAGLMLPFLLTASAVGMAFTVGVMFSFPTSRTRDVIWILSSLSMSMVYVALRFVEPEKLLRPDALHLVAQYLAFLQAPTAPYLPSWWVTRALSLLAETGRAGRAFWGQAALLVGVAAAVYALLVAGAQRAYAVGYSGAQEGRRGKRSSEVVATPEARWGGRLRLSGATAALLWKDRISFFRDVKYWSQLVLVIALMCVYLYSIRSLPLDSPDLKNIVAFLNLGVAGFVISSLGLRFTFPSISLEGRSFWVLRSAPVGVESLMTQKFMTTLVPMLGLSMTLILVSNRLLKADPFIFWLSTGTIAVMTWTLCGMGVGFGAVFPRFNLPNIHQIESSAGGFVYMAAALAYVGATLGIEAWPVQMHFQERFGRENPYDFHWLAACGAALAVLNLAAFALPWLLGRRTLEAYEEK